MNVINNVGVTGNSSIFLDKPKNNKNPLKVVQSIATTNDTFVKQTQTTNKTVNKKLIIAGIAIGAALLAAIAFKKNLLGAAKNVAKSDVVKDVLESETPKAIETLEEIRAQAEEYTTQRLVDIKRMIVDSPIEDRINGVVFAGADSVGKETTIENFIKTLSDNGFEIKRAQRVGNNTVFEDIACEIENYMNEAEELFKNTQKRTAIVVRDADRIAKERKIATEEVYSVISVLQDCEYAIERGYTLVLEAVNYSDIDRSLKRSGRVDEFMLCRPRLEESKQIWKKHLEVLEKRNNGILKKEAIAVLQEKI